MRAALGFVAAVAALFVVLAVLDDMAVLALFFLVGLFLFDLYAFFEREPSRRGRRAR